MKEKKQGIFKKKTKFQKLLLFFLQCEVRIFFFYHTLDIPIALSQIRDVGYVYWFLTVGKNHITEGHNEGLTTKSGEDETPCVFCENKEFGKLLAAYLELSELGGGLAGI